jgi:hypothetical protein
MVGAWYISYNNAFNLVRDEGKEKHAEKYTRDLADLEPKTLCMKDLMTRSPYPYKNILHIRCKHFMLHGFIECIKCITDSPYLSGVDSFPFRTKYVSFACFCIGNGDESSFLFIPFKLLTGLCTLSTACTK